MTGSMPGVFSSHHRSLETRLGITFVDKALLIQALTHRSFSKQGKDRHVRDNERLEFLGDAVLKLVVSEYLFETYPHSDEGTLTKLRAFLISDRLLAQWASAYELGAYMNFSYGEKQTGGAQRASNLGNAFEALIGAYYLDQGLAKVSAFLRPLVLASEKEATSAAAVDYKTTLQELMQKKRYELPIYTLDKEEGPDHQKTFYVTVEATWLKASRSAQGRGVTKKEAEQNAAKNLLQILRKKP